MIYVLGKGSRKDLGGDGTCRPEPQSRTQKDKSPAHPDSDRQETLGQQSFETSHYKHKVYQPKSIEFMANKLF
uniref:Uncharacterized protein n=1 Tax=Setaria italica TaxID=4555 RepID=K3ZYQ7_SETIT